MNQSKQHKPPSEVIFIRGVPYSLKCAFKAYCSLRGQSIKDALIQMMQEAVKQDGRDQ